MFPNPSYDVAVIGGGITGLTVAYHLASLDSTRRFCLLESQARLGGKILTEKHGDFVIEGGPDSFVSYKPSAIELCQQMGLGERLTGTHRERTSTFILHRGQLQELPEGLMLLAPTRILPFARSSLFSWSGKLRMGLDLILPRGTSSKDESLARFVRRRMGQEAVDRLARPLLAGIYAGDPEKMSLRATFPQFAEMEDKHRSLILGMLARRKQMASASKSPSAHTMFMTLKNGLSEIVEAIVRKLGPTEIVAGIPVQGVRCNGQSGYELRLGDGREIGAKAVVMALPAYAAADIIEEMGPEVSEELRSIRYASTATVSMGFRKKDCSHSLDGFGFVVSGRETRGMMACTWTSTKFPHRAPDDHVLLRFFLGGEGREAVMELSDEALIRLVREDLKSTLGIAGEPVVTRLYRWHRGNPQYDVGHQDRIQRIEKKLEGFPGLFVAGAAYYGVGVPDCIRNGRDVALRVASYLKDHSISATEASS